LGSGDKIADVEFSAFARKALMKWASHEKADASYGHKKASTKLAFLRNVARLAGIEPTTPWFVVNI